MVDHIFVSKGDGSEAQLHDWLQTFNQKFSQMTRPAFCCAPSATSSVWSGPSMLCDCHQTQHSSKKETVDAKYPDSQHTNEHTKRM